MRVPLIFVMIALLSVPTANHVLAGCLTYDRDYLLCGTFKNSGDRNRLQLKISRFVDRRCEMSLTRDAFKIRPEGNLLKVEIERKSSAASRVPPIVTRKETFYLNRNKKYIRSGKYGQKGPYIDWLHVTCLHPETNFVINCKKVLTCKEVH